MPGFELVIFDCDGVLVDSEVIAAQVESKLLNDAGYEITPEEMGERFSGLTWRDILFAVEREAGIPLQASLIDKSEAILDKRLANEVRPIEGAAEAVLKLGSRNCICSNSSAHRLRAMLQRTRLAPLFGERVYSAKDLGEGRTKPAPDIFLHAAERLVANPANVVVIEDSVHGIEGARTAGMRVIGFTGGGHTYPGHADRLTDAGAETVIARMSDLPATVAALSAWSELS